MALKSRVFFMSISCLGHGYVSALYCLNSKNACSCLMFKPVSDLDASRAMLDE
jgi:hypothetical protein